MTFNSARPPDTPLSEETVKVELSELKSTTRILDVAASSATLGGLTLGALAALEFGALAFLAASVVGAIVAFVARAYTQTRKKHLEEEISTLQESGEITKDEAIELTTRVELVYTDNPERVQGVSRR
jgi:hypothetical protein